MNETIAAAVVLYHPDKPALKHNVDSYLPHVSRLFIIDNTPGGSGLGDNLLYDRKVFYLANKKNEGIADALNKAAALAVNEKYRWLLTMDQDSFFENGEMEKFISFFRHQFMYDESTAIVAPSQEKTGDEINLSFIVETAVITSGNLLNLQIWQKSGGFETKLFIDEVDHEYCYRVNNAGYKVIRFPTVYLNHSLGTKKEAGYAGIVSKSKRTIHSPRRVYFIVRNYLYVRKKFKTQLPAEFKKRDKMMLSALKNNLLFSGQFFKTLKSICKGFRDFKRNNFDTTL